MARGGKRPGAGRKKGSGDRPHILNYWSETDIKDFFDHIKATYKDKDRLATWVGDQISGKAAQAVDLGLNKETLQILFDASFARQAKADSE